VAEGCANGLDVIKKYGFFPVVVLRPMKADHYFVLRFIIAFDSSIIEEAKKARMAINDIAKVILDIGGTPYKMAPLVAKQIWAKSDPSFYKFIAQIKDCLDPNGILNPGKILIDGSPQNPYKLRDLSGGYK
jgi:FAD/FMN-containing dehydrogenase